MSKSEAGIPECAALSALFENPCTLSDRIKLKDPTLVLNFTNMLICTDKSLGESAAENVKGRREQVTGKVIRALFAAVDDEVRGQAMRILLAGCQKKMR